MHIVYMNDEARVICGFGVLGEFSSSLRIDPWIRCELGV